MSLATTALNRAQQDAVEYGTGATPAPPLLVIAGAGSGKTSTLAHRVAHLVRHGADPQRLLLLTFSRRAAAELTLRVGRVLQAQLARSFRDAPPALPWAGTFHSIGAQLLREYAPRIGLVPNFTIHDRGDSEDLMGLVRQEADIDTSQARFPGAATCVAIYSRCVNAQAALHDVLADHFPWCANWEGALRPLFASYVAAKQAQHVLDFDDLLLYWAGMMEEPELAAEVSARFDHVLVDEYQDTNRLQGAIIRHLKPDGRGVTVVGDDAQAIYGFRAATVRNILDFPAQYTPPAQVITLERNYRSTQPILTASNAVIALASERFTKDLVTERTAGAKPRLVTVADESMQARFVAEEVLAQRERGVALRRQAVLFRTSSHSAAVELELARRNIPFVKFGGLKFLDAAHVKDVLGLLRWIDNGRARLPGFRTLRLMAGVGPATATRWLDALDASAEPLATMASFKAPAAAAPAWEALRAMYATMQARDSAWPAEMDALLAWYENEMPRLFEDAPVRLPDLAQLRRIAATYLTRERFLTELTLDPPSATSGEAGVPLKDEDYLTLSTIHSAKGQEWQSVHVLNCVDGCIPSDLATGRAEEIEEERRLLYVAMTRAKDDLALIVPQRFYVRQQGAGGDRHVYAAKSRFLPQSVCEHLDAQTWPVPPAAPPRDPQMKKLIVDLAAKLRATW
ncbi:MAG: ATP-dependent helicase [Burkholderiales bacterium]